MHVRPFWMGSVALGFCCSLGMMGCGGGTLPAPSCGGTYTGGYSGGYIGGGGYIGIGYSGGGGGYSGGYGGGSGSGYSGGYSGNASASVQGMNRGASPLQVHPQLVSTGCPVAPPSPMSPMITAAMPSSVQAGSPGFTLTIDGVDFTQDDVVQLQGASLSTTYVSATELQAQVPASSIVTPGLLSVVVNSSNYGPSSQYSLTVTPGTSVTGSLNFSLVNITANDMVWDTATQQIYLSIPNTSSTNPNTITALDPTTGQLGLSQFAGSNPDQMSLSSDDSYLYVGLDGSATVQRFTLPGLGTDISIPLGSSTLGPNIAVGIKAAPGLPHTVAVLIGNPSNTGTPLTDGGGLQIFDDATARPTALPGAYLGGSSISIDSIQWNSTATQIFASAGNGYQFTGGSNLYALNVNSSGVQLGQTFSGNYKNLHYDSVTGDVYSDSGQAFDPTTGSQIGTFGVQGIMIPDGTLGYAYFLDQPTTQSGSNTYTLSAYDLTHFTLAGSVSINNVVGTPVKIIRWGTNGLAILTQNLAPNLYPGAAVYLLNGSFVTNP